MIVRCSIRNGICLTAVLLIGFATMMSAAEEDILQLTLQVLEVDKNKPVPNAHVVVKFVDRKLLKDKRVSWEAKTNRDGKLVLNDIPAGAVKIQVIAKGYQTYGNDHLLEKSEKPLTIYLQPPQKQFSSYPSPSAK